MRKHHEELSWLPAALPVLTVVATVVWDALKGRFGGGRDRRERRPDPRGQPV